MARKGKHLLEVRFLPSQNGDFVLDLFNNNNDNDTKDNQQLNEERESLKQQFRIRVETLPSVYSNNERVFQISGQGLRTAIAGQPAAVRIHSVLPSLKSFSVEFDGPGAVEILQKAKSASRQSSSENEDSVTETNIDEPSSLSSGCTIEYLGQIPGAYAMSIKYDGFHVEGSPFKVDILPAHGMISDVPFNDSSKENVTESTDNNNTTQKLSGNENVATTKTPNAKQCVVRISDNNQKIDKGSSTHYVVAGKANAFIVDTSMAGEGVLMAGFHNSLSATEVKCKHLENNIYEVHYVIGEIGIHKLSVFWSGENIPGSPFEISVSSQTQQQQKFSSTSASSLVMGDMNNNVATSSSC